MMLTIQAYPNKWRLTHQLNCFPPEVDVVGPVHEGVPQPPLVPSPERYHIANICQTAVRGIATAPNESLWQGNAETRKCKYKYKYKYKYGRVAKSPNESLWQGNAESRNDSEVDRISQILNNF